MSRNKYFWNKRSSGTGVLDGHFNSGAENAKMLKKFYGLCSEGTLRRMLLKYVTFPYLMDNR